MYFHVPLNRTLITSSEKGINFTMNERVKFCFVLVIGSYLYFNGFTICYILLLNTELESVFIELVIPNTRSYILGTI